MVKKIFAIEETTHYRDKKKDVNKIFNKIFIIRREFYIIVEEKKASGVS